MARTILVFICLVSVIDFGYSVSVPYITKCVAADSKCLKSSSQVVVPIFAKGIPELGVETLDPAVFDKPIDSSTNGLKLIINDLVVTGLKDCVVKKLDRDPAKNKFIGKLLCNVVGDGTYEMNGQLLILPVRGEGKIHVVLRKIVISLDADVFDKVGKDGKKYWDVKRFTHSYDLKDKADVVFENLFSGSDVLGRAAKQVIESSGNEIILEVGPPVVEVIVKKVMDNIKKLFKNVPIDNLSLDD